MSGPGKGRLGQIFFATREARDRRKGEPFGADQRVACDVLMLGTCVGDSRAWDEREERASSSRRVGETGGCVMVATRQRGRRDARRKLRIPVARTSKRSVAIMAN